MKSKTIKFTARNVVELCDTELCDTPEAGMILLKTVCTLISRGTELAVLSGTAGTLPAVLGYSAVAVVLDVGSGVTSVKKGDRCLCYHSKHSSIQLIPERDVVKIEDDTLPAKEAVFCVVGCMGFQGVRRCRPELGESLMVMGLGLLGQYAVQTARLSGCYPVIALDFDAKRRELALSNGADAAFAPDDPGLKEKIHALTDSKGVDMLIEVTGNPQAIVQGLKLTAKFGRCALVGCSRTATESIDFYNLVHRPGITILGAHNMARPLEENKPGVWTMREDMKTLLRLMAAGRLDAKRMLTRIADPADAPEIYAQLLKENSGVPGIVFDWKNY